MSQMTAYCFKCGASLKADTIQCPYCGRIQRSMVVRNAPPVDRSLEVQDEAYDEPYPPPRMPPPAPRSSRGRVLALAGAGILGLFLVSFAVGQTCAGGSDSRSVARSGSLADAPSPVVPTPTASSPASSPTPGARTSSTPAPGQSVMPGVPSAARWVRVTSTIPGGKCTTSQGCPVQGTFRNGGQRGGGIVTFSLIDSSGAVVGTYMAPLPTTEAGGTAEVSGYANGDQLPAYLRSGGIVQLKVDVQNVEPA